MIALETYLMDGPLCPYALMAGRERKLLAMAGELMRSNAFAERGDAILLLRHLGYAALDVMILVDEARAIATQELIAEAMSAS